MDGQSNQDTSPTVENKRAHESTGDSTRTLLGKVKNRQRWASIGKRTYLALVIFSGLFALSLLVSRLLGLLPDVFDLFSLLAVPLTAFITGLIFHRRFSDVDAARATDHGAKTKDLFLTSAMIDKSPGAYQDIVLNDAENRAGNVAADNVVPFHWLPRARNSAMVLSLLALGILFLPQLDPFKHGEARAKTQELEKELDRMKKAREARAAQLQRAKIDEKHSAETKAAIDKLKNTFNTMKPEKRQDNFKRLTENQQALGKQWKEKSDKMLRDALERNPSNQRFGMDSPNAQEWKKELLDGKIDKMLGEVNRLKNLAQDIANMPEGAAKKQAQKQLKQGIKELSEFARKEMNSAQLNTALSKALEQLNMANMNGQMAPEAMKELAEQLDLAKMEMQENAQTRRDMQELEKALEALAMAQQCNNQGENGLDGGQCQNPGQTPGEGAGEKGEGSGQMANEQGMTMDEYQDFYEQMLAQQGQGQGQGRGQGMKGPGTGEGGEAPEDPTKKNNFKSERSKTALHAGRILMKWETKETAKKGAVAKDYLNHVREVQQGVSEAIVQEQIPPGYHESIQNYFDSLENTSAAPDNAVPAPASNNVQPLTDGSE